MGVRARAAWCALCWAAAACSSEGGDTQPPPPPPSWVEVKQAPAPAEYPKDARGVVLCGADATCFLAQARACAPAELTHTQSVRAMAVTQKVVSRYRLLGPVGDACRLTREAIDFDVEMGPEAQEMLRTRGHDEAEIAQRREVGIAQLRQRNVPLECDMPRARLIAMAKLLTRGEYDPAHWAKCRRGVVQTGPAAATSPAPRAARP